ncbi:hypothetical protein HPB47_022539 [Ixodes persulcatus]|uniref:Uncharacterized protein n=1 Tax=Ixodes persulcatus TaxID=34615 RepID=A0AC60QCU8_IXOPE|nr:hypothetical protein HPB47_022539 [Ixodes persulcatus]
MVTKNNEMLHRYAAHVSQRCPGVSTAEEILFFLNSVGDKTNAEFVAPCSANGAQLCHLVEYLSVCNDFLRLISMELKEVEPGEFGFFPLEMHLFRQPVGGAEDLSIRGWILLHWLLQEHRCIKTLMLPRIIDPKYQDVLSDALQLNSGLKKLTLRNWQEKKGFSNISAIGTLAHLEELDMGHETGTEGRLEISASIRDPQVFESSLKNSTSLTKMRYSPSYNSRPMLPGAFHHLLQHHHLQELNIRLDHPIEMESATSLAVFLSTTSSLRHVALEFRAAAALSRILVEGIAGNSSLTSLSISFWTFEAPETDLLWHMLESSKTLKTLTLELLEFEHSQVLDQVPGGLLNNHYLLEATIQQNPEHCPNTYFSGTRGEVRKKLIFISTQTFQFGVQELMRRNLSTLHRAVQFVMGARGRRFAEAFERVSKGLTLVEALKKATGESDEEIKRKVASSMRYLDEHFLAEAGVVRDTVVCGESSRAQLDQIGLYNWLHIRQFLKVTDIILKPKGLPAGPSSSKKHC